MWGGIIHSYNYYVIDYPEMHADVIVVMTYYY